MIGTSLRHYEITGQLGAGGMGEVYRARDSRLRREVAIKILPASLTQDLKHVTRFEREAMLLAALNHPHIASIHGFEEDQGRHFLVLELIEGETLEERLRRGRLAVDEAIEVCRQIAEAVQEAHQKGIIHRDLKPGNIKFTRNGKVKVLDFGLAKALETLASETKQLDSTLPGAVLGTPAYMSPEQAKGEEVDEQSDIWSFGCILYECLTGKRLFGGKTMTECVTAILQREPDWELLPGNTPPNLKQLLRKCLERNPRQRLHSMADVVSELERAAAALRGGESNGTSGRAAWFAVSGAIVCLLILGGYLLWQRQGNTTTNAGSGERISSLAVKPLDDFSGDPNQAYLSDGMTEALCAALGNISALRVPGRSSVMRYKGGHKNISEMARELNVDAIVEGSIQRSGNDVRVGIGLIDASRDKHIWATNYVRDLGQFFRLQSEIAQAIASEIRARLTPEDQMRIARVGSENREVVEACLIGKHQLAQWSDRGFSNALRYFQKAIEIDANYAPAHLGIAATYGVGGVWGLWPPRVAMPKAKAAVEKALELDPLWAEAYAARAAVRLNYDWDWAGAEADLKKAMELTHNSPDALDGYATFLVTRERFDEAAALQRRAIELDPLLTGVRVNLAWIYHNAGRYKEAEFELLKALELDANYFQAHFLLGWNYQQLGKTNEALAQFQKTIQLDPESPMGKWGLGYALGLRGQRAEALQIIDELNEMATKRYVTPWAQANVYLGLGEKELAMDWLEKAYEDRDALMVILKVDPGTKPLRQEPRFLELLRRVEGGNQKTSALSSSNKNQLKSVAVLPFANMSAEKADEYLSDGMTEELINVLAKVKGLRVPGRSSSFAFKGKSEQDIFRKVGQQLNVTTVLEGSVRKAGNQLRITAQLINVADGFHLWSETYDRSMTNIFAIQSDIAQHVAESLKVHLGVEHTGEIAKQPTKNLEAYQLYLKGRFFSDKWTDASVAQAIEYLSRAVQADPAFASAYAALSEAHVFSATLNSNPAEAIEQAERAALNAVELNNQLAEAHCALGVVRLYQWRWNEAEQHLKESLLLDPTRGMTHDWLAWWYASQGRLKEAISQTRKGLENDPLSVVLNPDLAWHLMLDGRAQEAITQCQETLKIDPANYEATRVLAMTYGLKGDFVSAHATLDIAQKLNPGGTWDRGLRGWLYARDGNKEKAIAIANELATQAERTFIPPEAIAGVYAGLKDADQFFAWAERGYNQRSTDITYIKAGGFWKEFSSDPRYAELVQRLGLPR